MITKRGSTLALVSLIFALSGCSALIFETLWFRVAGYVLGSSVWSAAAVLMAFMAGLGIGNAIMAFAGSRLKRPFRFYIIIELVIAVAGVLSVVCLPLVAPFLSNLLRPILDDTASLNLFRFIIALVVLLLPAIAMGATLPVLQKALHHQDQDFSSSIGRLYGWNTAGAVLGVLLAEFVLIASLGVKNSAYLAAFLNLLAAILVWRFFSDDELAGVQQHSSSKPLAPLASRALLVGPFLAGFILLALEVVWFRYIILSQVGTSIVFAIMLAIVLFGLSIGGLLVTLFKCRPDTVNKMLVGLPLVSMVFVLLGYTCFQYITVNHMLVLYSNQWWFIGPALMLMLPTSILSGMLFPYYGDLLFRKSGVNTRATGVLTLANTLGAAIGSAVATFYLLPVIGIENSIFVLALLYLLLPLSMLLFSGEKRSFSLFKPALLPIVAVILCVFVYPFGSMEASLYSVGKVRYKEEKLVHSEEELNATLQYFEHDYLGQPLYYRLATNSYSMSSTDFYSKRYMKLFVYLSQLLHGDIKDVLQISYGVGNTAEAVVSLNSVETFDVVDISEDILRLSKLIHQSSGVFPLEDPRTQIYVEDGRFFLQTRNKQYDLITGEPPPPKMAGVASLYTQEYFQLLKSRLAEGGIATYWLPVHNLFPQDSKSIIRAFCNVFSDCSLWNSSSLDWILIGTRDGLPKLFPYKLRENVAEIDGKLLRGIGFENSDQLLAMFMADSSQLQRLTQTSYAVVDDFPYRISPDFENVYRYSDWYDNLLSIRQRKYAFKNSAYLKEVFSPVTLRSAYSYLDWEGYMTAARIFPMGYMKDYAITWEKVVSLLKTTSDEFVPMSFFQLTPDKVAILDSLGCDSAQQIELVIECAKLRFIRRDYGSASRMLEPVFDQVGDIDPGAVKLYFLASAMAEKAVSAELEEKMQHHQVDASFLHWLKQAI